MNHFRPIAFALALLSVSMAVPSCSWFEKKVVTVADDVKACFGPDVKGDLGDIIGGVETALVCDVESGGQALPACTVEGLQTIAQEIGPNGKADVQCVVTKLAEAAAGQRTGASPEEVLRTQRAKLYVKAATLALRSPGDATPRTGPTLDTISLRGGPEAGHRAHNPTSQVQFLAPQPFAYTGENPGAALARCTSACGSKAAIAPPGGCRCQVGSGRAAHWVAAR